MTAIDLIRRDHITFGVQLPIDNDFSPEGQVRARAESRPFGVPREVDPAVLVQRAEELGIEAVWMRDVPVHDPEFGDAGQVYDPFPLLGYLAAKTSTIALGTAAIVAPLRQPIHLAKMAATIHQLSSGRFIMGIASGDRPVEYPLMGIPFEERGAALRETVGMMRHLWSGSGLQGPRGPVTVRPFVGEGPPVVIAGMGQQSLQWIAANLDGWFTYPGAPEQAKRRIDMWQQARAEADRPAAPIITGFAIDLLDDPAAPWTPIRFGATTGRNALIEHIRSLQTAGIAHMTFDFRRATRSADEVLDELGAEVFPVFAAIKIPS